MFLFQNITFMVYTIGETVLDIIFKTIDDVKVKPGGSMLNTAVSLGRLGISVAHISTMSTDKASDLLIDFLEQNGVNSKFIFRADSIKTSLALAYLNESNDAEYTFYKDKLESQEELSFPALTNFDIIHFGSFFSLNPNMHHQLHQFFENSAQQNVIKLYDPNFRKPHLPDLPMLKPMIENNFNKADIVKGSNEDFENIFGLKTGEEVWSLLMNKGVKVLFYTKGERGSEVFSAQGSISVNSAKIKVISTIGAGDTYSAGIIYFLKKQFIEFPNLDTIKMEVWRECAIQAHVFSEATCQSLDNYLSVEFCKLNKYV